MTCSQPSGRLQELFLTLADDAFLALTSLTGLTFVGGGLAYATIRIWPLSTGYTGLLALPVALVLTAIAIALIWVEVSTEGRTRSFFQLAVGACALGAFLDWLPLREWASIAICVAALVVLLATRRITLYGTCALVMAFTSVAAVPQERALEDSSIHVLGVLRASIAAAVLLSVLFRSLDTRGNKRIFGIMYVAFGLVLCGAGALPDSGVSPNDIMSAVFVFFLGTISIHQGFRRRDTDDSGE